MKHLSLTKVHISKIFLIIVSSLIPLLGVLWWGWSLANVVILFWIENLIIGVWTLLKMLVARGDKSFASKLPLCIFFIIHYGFFCMGHGIFLLIILKIGNPVGLFPFSEMIEQGLITRGVLIGTGAMVVTHGVSFFLDFWQSPNRLDFTAQKIMMSPYGHIIVVHIALLIGAIASQKMGSPIALLLLLIIGKAILDLTSEKFLTRLKK